MRSTGLKQGVAAVLILMAGVLPGRAEDIALVIGNRNYTGAADVAGADGVVEAAGALRDRQVGAVAGVDLSQAEMRGLLAQFEQMVPLADGLLVVLAGRFVQGGGDTWFLPVDGDVPGLTGLASQSLALSPLLRLLATAPGRAVLVLATDERDAAQGPFLHDGIGPLDVPQGVSVVQGDPKTVARLLRDVLAVPGAPLDGRVARDGGLRLSGYLPEGHAFLPGDVPGGGNPAALEDAESRIDRLESRLEQAERQAERAQQSVQQAADALAAADQALWADSRSIDSGDAYRRYLGTFPDGRFAADARTAIRDIRDEPARAARLAEEALKLTREQRQEIQRDLSILGFNTRGIDGIFGAGTRSAISRWQASRDQRESGYLDRPTIRQLATQAERRAGELKAEEEARQEELRRADNAYWQQLGEGRTESALRSYLDRYPDGQWANTARDRLAQIESDRTPTSDRAELLAWRRAMSQDSEDSYRTYLRAYPRGAFMSDAQARLKEMARPDPQQEAARAGEDRLNLPTAGLRAIEDRLDKLGLEPGPVDGTFDAQTRRAIRQYQRRADMPPTGYLSEALVVRLLADAVRNILR